MSKVQEAAEVVNSAPFCDHFLLVISGQQVEKEGKVCWQKIHQCTKVRLVVGEDTAGSALKLRLFKVGALTTAVIEYHFLLVMSGQQVEKEGKV